MASTSAAARDAGAWPVGRVLHERRWRRLAIALAIVAIVFGLLVNLGAPLRRVAERRVNAALKGYTVAIGGLVLNPFGLAVELHDVTLVQNARPSPPIAQLPRWKTSLHWGALLHGAIVADVLFERPTLWIQWTQAAAENADAEPVQKRGWQDAVQAVYPLKVNALRVQDATVTYHDDSGSMPPVRLEHLDVEVDDFLNVRSQPGHFPSPLRASADLASGGRLHLDGAADFLAKPTAAVRARLALDDVQLKPLAPLAHAADADLKGGTLAMHGRIESTARGTRVDVADAALDHPRVDIARTQRNAAQVDRAAQHAARATAGQKAPPAIVNVRRATVVGGELGYVERTATPPYRLFLADPRVRLVGFSNQASARHGTATIAGRFMGSGATRVDARFGGDPSGSDLAIDVRLEDVDLTSLNDLLRATGGFDVAKGELSVYAQARVHEQQISGYVKPLFGDLDVYDPAQDRDKTVFRQFYERMIGAAASLLRNRPREEVATVTELTGRVDDPNASILDTVVGLVQNAYIRAILPGLERRRSPG